MQNHNPTHHNPLSESSGHKGLKKKTSLIPHKKNIVDTIIPPITLT